LLFVLNNAMLVGLVILDAMLARSLLRGGN